jgi:hypothetical protein
LFPVAAAITRAKRAVRIPRRISIAIGCTCGRIVPATRPRIVLDLAPALLGIGRHQTIIDDVGHVVTVSIVEPSAV